MKVNGVCEVVFEKTTKRGKMYSICVKIDGEDKWFGCGSNRPSVAKGDVVEFTGEQNGQWWEVVGEVKKVSTAPAAVKSGGGGWNDPERQKSIVAQSSIKSAIDFLNLALDSGALVLGAANAKAAKKFDILEAALKEKATEFYNIALNPDSFFDPVDEEEDDDDDFNPVPE